MTPPVPFLSSEHQNLFKPMLPLPFFVWIFVLLYSVRGFCVPAFGALNPHTVCLLATPALLLSPLPRRPSHTQVACPHQSPHLSLLFQSYHCVPGKLQNNEFLAENGIALSPRSKPTPVMPGIQESAFHRLLWPLRVYIPLLPALGEEKEGQRAALLATNELILLREAIRKLNFNLWIRKPELTKKHTFPSCVAHPADLSIKRRTRRRPPP